MAILEKEVLVSVSGKNIQYYENLNYIIPKTKNGKVILGEKILVRIEDLTHGSHVAVTKICDMENCTNVTPNQPYQQVIKSRNKGGGKDRCNDCGKKFGGEQLKSNVKYENSLEYYAKENNMKYLLNEFSTKNINLPSEVSRGTNDDYLWVCPQNHEYEMPPKQRTRKDEPQNCPYCSNQRILRGYNDLRTTNPEVAELLKDKNRGFEISSGSKKKELFVCPDCDYEDYKSVYTITHRGFSCSRCGDGYSFPEKVMFNVLEQLSLYFETQKIFEWSKNYNHINNRLSGDKKYDFYIPSLNCIIETHGEQHYKDSFTSFNGRTLKEEQFNDEIKVNLAIDNGIEHYIVIDCSLSNIEYIKNSVISHSQLKNIIDLNNLNWDICNEFATNSLVRVACEYWNSGICSTIEVGKLMKLNCGTVAKYLKRATELGWCDYDSKQAQSTALKKCASSNKKQIMQLTMANEFVKDWSSITEAGITLNINPSSISSVCKGRIKTYGGYKWVYKEDFHS